MTFHRPNVYALLNADGSFNRSAIMRDAHRVFRNFREIRPSTTFGQRMRYAWLEAQAQRSRWIVDRLSGNNPALAFALNGALASPKFVVISQGVH